MAWYQRTYFNFSNRKLIHYIQNLNIIYFLHLIIILIFLFYFDFFSTVSVNCSPFKKETSFLQRHLIGNHAAYVYKNIEFNVVNELMYNIKHLNFNKLNYNIYEFNDINGKKFPRWHPLSHYHLNFLEFSNINFDILVNMQFSTQNFNNCYLLGLQDLSLKDRPQFISNNFYFYQKKELLTKLPNFNVLNYLNEYNDKINNHVELVKNLYKI